MRTPRNDRLSDKDDATQTGREKTPGRDAQSATAPGKRSFATRSAKRLTGRQALNAVASSRVSMMHAMG
jgi:hypothetical protein